jgi:hypothetical protein
MNVERLSLCIGGDGALSERNLHGPVIEQY